MNTEATESNYSYQPTYWNGKGRYQEAYDLLRADLTCNFTKDGRAVEVPSKGKTRYLAKFQKATWAYYDLFNNHLWNERKLFTKTFGFSIPNNILRDNNKFTNSAQNVFFRMTDEVMDRIILLACAERNINIK